MTDAYTIRWHDRIMHAAPPLVRFGRHPLLLREAPDEREKLAIRFRVHLDDYFATLAARLDLLVDESGTCAPKLSDKLKNLRDELAYVQEQYWIKKRED